jgi:MFS transporter, Spinster family, sphingosine-1-phosphate transporter
MPLDKPRPQAWTVLVVFTAMNLLNYMDRYVVPAVQESIKHSLGLKDLQIGGLATAFLWVYLLSAPAFGAQAAKRSRTRVIGVGVAIWSIATALGGLAMNYGQLLAARATVGIGEAAYGTIAPAVLADVFPERMRGRVFALFYMAIPVGAALGYVVGGQIDQMYSWRAAFFVAGAPGLLFALIAVALKDPPREDDGAPAPTGYRSYGPLLKNPPYVRTVLGYIAYTFALGGISIWMPSFLVRVHGMSQADANKKLGLVVAITGLVGTFAGGWIADAVAKRTRQANLWVSGITMLAAVPLAWWALMTPSLPTFWTAVFAAELLLFASTGPINAAIVSEVAPALRAAAMALSIFAIHLFGDAISPTLIGWISDRDTLAHAVMIIPFAVIVSGAIWTYAAWKGERTAS